jgi:hypothetical protein
MQYEEQQGSLVRKRRTLTSFLAWSLNDDEFVTNYAIVNGLRRLGEQIELQHLARMKVLIQSAINLLRIFSHLATPARMRIVRHNLLEECDVFRLTKLSTSTAVLWSELWMRPLSRSWAEICVEISCAKVDYDKSG